MKIKIHKMREDAIIPERKHYNDAGADIYAVESTIIKPYETVVMGTGLGVEIPDGFMGIMLPRSSTGARGIDISGTPIDSGYHGEIHVVATNHNDRIEVVNAGERLAQLVIIPVVMADFVEELGEDRGLGAFGSTGR